MTLPDPPPYYRVQVTCGDYSWDVERDPDAPPPVPDYGLADPLTVRWALPNSDLVYVNPDPIAGSFSLIVADVADVADLTITNPVWVLVHAWPASDPHDPIVAVHGRVADVEAAPHPLGMILTVSWVDYTVDLAEDTVGEGDWPSETVDVRVDRLADELGLPTDAFAGGVPTPADLTILGKDPALYTLPIRTAAPVNARTYLVDLLDRTAFGWRESTSVETIAGKPYVGTAYAGGAMPFPALGGDPTTNPLPTVDKFYTVFRTDRDGDEPPGWRPAILGDTGGGLYGVVIDPAPADDTSRVIDACDVSFSARYALTKDNRVDTYVVSGPFTDGTTTRTVQDPDPVPVTGRIETDWTNPDAAIDLGGVNLVGRDSDSWRADSFLFYADRDPIRLLNPTPLFWDDAWSVANVQYPPVTVTGVDPAQNPTGESWFAGQIVGAEFTLAAGRYTARLTVRRNLPKSGTAGTMIGGLALDWSGIDADFPAVTWNDLNTRQSWFDARLLRSEY